MSDSLIQRFRISDAVIRDSRAVFPRRGLDVRNPVGAYEESTLTDSSSPARA